VEPPPPLPVVLPLPPSEGAFTEGALSVSCLVEGTWTDGVCTDGAFGSDGVWGTETSGTLGTLGALGTWGRFWRGCVSGTLGVLGTLTCPSATATAQHDVTAVRAMMETGRLGSMAMCFET
jgi:hypothetical protein